MPEYLSPGVYIEEMPGPQPIQGASTSTAGMVGVTQKGPTEGRPELVTSWGDFRRNLGGLLPEPDPGDRTRWELDDQEGGFWWRFPLAVKGFFDNGGRRLFVKRVVSSAATAAERVVTTAVLGPPAGDGTPTVVAPAAALPPLLRARAVAAGAWGRDLTVRVRPAVARRLAAVAPGGGGPVAVQLQDEFAPDDTAAVVTWPRELDGVTAPVVLTIGRETFDVALLPPVPADPQGRTLTVDVALRGKRPRVRHQPGTAVKVHRHVVETADVAADGSRPVPVTTTDDRSIYAGALVRVGPGRAPATVSAVVPPPAPGLLGTVTLAPRVPAAFPAVFESDLLEVVEATVDVRYEVGSGADTPPAPDAEVEVVEESLPGLRLQPLSGHPRSVVDVVNTESALVRFAVVPLPPNSPPVGWDVFPGAPTAGAEGFERLQDGDDALGALAPEDFVGTDGGSGRRTGVQALEDVEDISICAVPGMWSRTVQGGLLGHCERLRDRFAVLDAQRGLGIQDVQAFRAPLDSTYAALYHPWVRLRDPLTRRSVPVPPSGHVLGLYAAVDNDRGVHKAPANVIVQEITGFDDDINQREQDLLNPIGINALREFPNRGRRVWGARTISSVPEWRYVPVRRLFIFIEKSLKQGTQWVVFEPNAEPLWALVTQAVTNFLDSVWRSGALEGTRQEEAFYVRCDRSTMTEDDVANGRLVVEIGIAPVKPAEFVIFRFRQKTRAQLAAV